MLSDASPLLRKAFEVRSEYEESPERILYFPADDADLFGHLIECIYSKSFSMDMFENATSDSEREVQAAQLYVLAEKYGVETVELNIGIKLHAYSKGRVHSVGNKLDRMPPERRAVEIAYKYTYRNSILRRVFLDWYSLCTVCEDTGLRDWLPTVPDLAADLVVTTSRKNRYFDMEERDYFLRLIGKEYKVL